VLDHEVSSCEPCYSWVQYHTLELGDRHRFTMGLYGLLAGGASQRTFVSSETWEAIFGASFTTAAFVDPMIQSTLEERGDELHVLRMTPLAFLGSGGFSWKEAPTIFGPTSIGARLDQDRTRLDIEFTPPVRNPPKAIYLHVPPVPGLRLVTLNGKALDPSVKVIRLE